MGHRVGEGATWHGSGGGGVAEDALLQGGVLLGLWGLWDERWGPESLPDVTGRVGEIVSGGCLRGSLMG